METELEKTFLVKKIPQYLENSKFIEIIDLYIPRREGHPILRIRKKGDVYEITKKIPAKSTDASIQHEHTIALTAEEADVLNRAKGKKLRKLRYFYPFEGHMGEIGVFQDELEGLILADFEFKSKEEMDAFVIPDFCLADVTQEVAFAGGSLAGMKYEELKKDLEKYNYKKIIFKAG